MRPLEGWGLAGKATALSLLLLSALQGGPALGAPLSLDAVLATVDERVPQLAQAEASLAGARGKALAARGAFDPSWKTGAFAQTSGNYPRSSVKSELVAASALGPELSLGWRRGAGDIADYDGKVETASGGELRLDVDIPLLQDLGLPAEQAARLATEERVRAAEAGLDLKRQAVLGLAARRYWSWVAAGAKLEVDQRLLGLAEARQSGIERKVALGSLAELEELDNSRIVLSRRAALVTATQDVDLAAIDLSLLYRDRTMAPVVPAAAELPPLPSAAPPPLADLETLTARAAAGHPALRQLGALVEAARVERRRAGRALLPDLAATGGVAQDLGSGSSSLLQTDMEVGLRLETDLGWRAARGKVGVSEATLAGLMAKERELRDELRATLQQLLLTRQAVSEQWSLSAAAARQAEKVALMESRAFELGSADVFKLNQREQTLASARKAEIDALVDLYTVDAAIRTTTAGW